MNQVLRAFKRMLKPLRFLNESKWHRTTRFYRTGYWEKVKDGFRALFGHSELSGIWKTISDALFGNQTFMAALQQNILKATKNTDLGYIDSFFLFSLGVPLAIVFLAVGAAVNCIGYFCFKKLYDDSDSDPSSLKLAAAVFAIPFIIIAYVGTVTLVVTGAALLAAYIGVKCILIAAFSPFVLIGAGIAEGLAQWKGRTGKSELKQLAFENIDNTNHPLDENTFDNLTSYNRCMFKFYPDSDNELLKEGCLIIAHKDNETIVFDILLRASQLAEHPEAAKILFKWDMFHINHEDELPQILRGSDSVEIERIDKGKDIDDPKYHREESTKPLHISRWLADNNIFHDDSDKFKAHLEEINPKIHIVQ